ncbi:MAG: poly(ADP-ribose) glycohydrolase domain-containing protein [Collinsella sp.]
MPPPRRPSGQRSWLCAVLRHGRARLCLVHQPGGGYIQGYLGQEATLCADSYLYNVLDKQRKWYGENRRRNINCELYRNRALVVPAVRFDRNHVHAYADVIVPPRPTLSAPARSIA